MYTLKVPTTLPLSDFYNTPLCLYIIYESFPMQICVDTCCWGRRWGRGCGGNGDDVMTDWQLKSTWQRWACCSRSVVASFSIIHSSFLNMSTPPHAAGERHTWRRTPTHSARAMGKQEERQKERERDWKCFVSLLKAIQTPSRLCGWISDRKQLSDHLRSIMDIVRYVCKSILILTCQVNFGQIA